MFELIKNIILEMRPRQWVKNLTLYVFLVFSKQFFILHQFLVVSYAIIIFTLLTSSIYIINDLLDIESDKKNPEKKNRPIASGKISKKLAIVLFVIFFVTSFITSFLLGEFFFFMCVSYFVLMILYSLWLKNLAIFDALAIASGFVIRVLAGGLAIGTSYIYSWIVIVTISVALLLAFGKRRSELTLLGEHAVAQRKVLVKYPVDLLNSMISTLVATTFLSYILLTFETDLSSPLLQRGGLPLPNPLFKSQHLLKLTIPVVFYGIARYLYIIYTKKYGGTPEKALFTDLPMLFTIVFWILSTFILIYAGK